MKRDSLYHQHFNQTKGIESHPTFYMDWHQNKPCHIDYWYASTDLIEMIKGFNIGSYDGWIDYSDHIPLFVELLA